MARAMWACSAGGRCVRYRRARQPRSARPTNHPKPVRMPVPYARARPRGALRLMMRRLSTCSVLHVRAERPPTPMGYSGVSGGVFDLSVTTGNTMFRVGVLSARLATCAVLANPAGVPAPASAEALVAAAQAVVNTTVSSRFTDTEAVGVAAIGGALPASTVWVSCWWTDNPSGARSQPINITKCDGCLGTFCDRRPRAHSCAP